MSSGQSIDSYALNPGDLVYTPDSNAPASYSTTFAFSVNDGQDNSLPTSFTLNVGVTPNTPPTITGSFHSLPATSSKTITTADLGYSDPEGDWLQSITITVLPTTGALTLYGNPVIVGTNITAQYLENGYLAYSPNTTNQTAHVATFSFTASDGHLHRFPSAVPQSHTLDLLLENQSAEQRSEYSPDGDGEIKDKNCDGPGTISRGNSHRTVFFPIAFALNQRISYSKMGHRDSNNIPKSNMHGSGRKSARIAKPA